MNSVDGLDVNLLEPLLRDWVKLIGLADTMAIAKRFGGTQVYISEDGGAFVDLIGPEKAALIGKQYVGERPLVPKALRALRHVRDQQLRTLRATKGVRQAARELGLGERQAWAILGSADDQTGDLFG